MFRGQKCERVCAMAYLRHVPPLPAPPAPLLQIAEFNVAVHVQMAHVQGICSARLLLRWRGTLARRLAAQVCTVAPEVGDGRTAGPLVEVPLLFRRRLADPD